MFKFGPAGEEIDVTSRAATPETFAIRHGRLAAALALVCVVVAFVGLAAQLVLYHLTPSHDGRLAAVMRRISLDFEPSLVAWLGSLLLVTIAALLGMIAWDRWRRGAAFHRFWAFLACVFVFLSIDEAIMLHEMTIEPTKSLFKTEGLLYHSWVIPYGVFTLVIAVASLRWLAHLDRRTRRLMIGAAVLFVSGAVVFEMVGGKLIEKYSFNEKGVFVQDLGSAAWPVNVIMTIEELLELLGCVLMIYALLDYIGRELGPVTLEVRSSAVLSSTMQSSTAQSSTAQSSTGPMESVESLCPPMPEGSFFGRPRQVEEAESARESERAVSNEIESVDAETRR